VRTHGVAAFDLDIGGYTRRTYAHVVGDLGNDLLLGLPWMVSEKVDFQAGKLRLWLGVAGIRVRLRGEREPKSIKEMRGARLVSASVFAASVRRIRRELGEDAANRVRAISLADIDKALRKLDQKAEEVDPAKYIPADILRDFPSLFSPKEAMKLPPRRPGVDHEVNLLLDSSGNEKALPWGSLYSMSREELFVLRKILTDLLDKGFIRASSSEAAAPILFVKKPGGGIRFCCDYRALNAITRKDRYPLPLISETLRSLAAAKWFTKLDIVAAFHKIRMAEGHEHKTAFRTRFGLFEWMVCPFGLSGAPATFQRYINDLLRRYLDDFVTAYLDDILIYTSGSRRDHMAKVRLVLIELAKAGLSIDPKKCAFVTKEVKYLGFVVQAGRGIACDPEKQRAIREWLAPSSLKGIQSFLGFANYYRVFIPDFAGIAGPLIALTKKGTPFTWGRNEQAAFSLIKRRFIEAPILREWDPTKKTFVETDASGYALGGSLSQEDEQGHRYAVAFFSQRLAPAEKNYQVHDREMLAVLRCLQAWRSHLHSCEKFTVVTDHKNLQYFMQKQNLSSRQVRWAEYLSEFNFEWVYRPGSEAAVPDALSRREQDEPKEGGSGDGDYMQLIPSSALLPAREVLTKEPSSSPAWDPPMPRVSATTRSAAKQIAGMPSLGGAASPQEPSGEAELLPGPLGEDYIAGISQIPSGEAERLPVIFPDDKELEQLWQVTAPEDSVYQGALAAVKQEARRFPPALKLKVNLSECSIDEAGRLLHRDRIWVPGGSGLGDGEADRLRVRIVDKIHTSQSVGHPGREGTLEAVGRRFYWPGISKMIRRYVARCSLCGASKIWREAKQGFLKPLPVPDRPRCDLAMDFMTGLPRAKDGKETVIWVIVDRLTRAVTLEPMGSTDAAACAQRFLNCHYRFHGMPTSIVSDRGPPWVSEFWRHFCKLAGITQRLSTSYHPQTDGHPERANQEVQAYLRCFIDFSQRNWKAFLPAAQLALNSRKVAATGISPFFLEHGFHPEPLKVQEATTTQRSSAKIAAEAFLGRLQQALEFCRAAAASTSARDEEAANKRRGQSEVYKPGDWVWWDTRNYKSARPSKKLDFTHQKYQVERMVSPLVVELRGVPGAIYPRTHVDMLRRAHIDTLPGQTDVDWRPPALEYNGNLEWEVQEILCAATKKRGRGEVREALVQWIGHLKPTWEPISALKDVEALDAFEASYGDIMTNDGPLAEYMKDPRGVRAARS
jgi:transposase InsO family protein